MKKYILGSLLIAALLCTVDSFAQRGHRYERRYDNRVYYSRHYPTRSSVSIIASLPFGTVGVSFGNRHYHYYDGYYYQPYGRQYMLVEPPIGIMVPALPPNGVWVTIGTRPYYQFNSVFYAPFGTNSYQVVQNPQQTETTTTTTSTAKTADDDIAGSEYEKVVLEGKTYYKKGDKYYKATVNDDGEISYKEIGETGK